MKLGVISDTHLSGAGCKKPVGRVCLGISGDVERLRQALEPYFAGVQAVLHAGDILDASVLEMLSRFGPVHAVCGNMDPQAARARLPEKQLLELGNFRIGLIHGWGSPNGLAARVRSRFAKESPDCIVFGHSHSPYDLLEDDILMFNPGSATDRRFAPRRTVGILHLDNRIWGEHIELE